MSEAEKAYETYLQSEDKTKQLDDLTYYKAVYIDMYYSDALKKKIAHIMLPNEIFKSGARKSIYLRSDLGYTFTLHGADFYSFRGGIPEWYLKCRVYTVDVDEDCKDIGSYFTFIDEVCKNAVVE